MKVTLNIEKEYEVNQLQVIAGVRYWEDATVNGEPDENGNLIPCKVGDAWQPIIDIDKGIILNWHTGKEANIHYKVCDDGEYWLLDENGNRLVKAGGYYVPDFLSIDDNGYGDYIIMKVDKEGKINNWRFDMESFKNDDQK